MLTHASELKKMTFFPFLDHCAPHSGAFREILDINSKSSHTAHILTNPIQVKCKG
jgi:hypothetical protein